MVEVWNNATSSQDFSLSLTVKDAAGKAVGTTSGSGSLAAGAAVEWSPKQARQSRMTPELRFRVFKNGLNRDVPYAQVHVTYHEPVM